MLVLPSLTVGLYLDDYIQIAHLEGWSPTHPGALDLYSFLPRDPAVGERLRVEGVMPYFTAPGLQIAFVRPLSSVLIWADYALFGRMPLPRHVHSLLWYALLLAGAAALYRRVLPGRLATLALLIFCVDDGHALTVAFVAARNGTVAAALVVLALVAHLRWRCDDWRAGAVLAPLLAVLGLAAGEMAVGALAYLVAWELVERRPGWRRALAPTLILVVLYLAAYRLTGSGAHNSGAYLDPFGKPLEFLRQLPERALLLFGNLVFSTPVDLVPLEARLRVPLVVAGVAACVLIAVWLPGALRRMAPDEARTIRWLGLGALGGLLAGTPALIGDRVLLASGVGGAAVMAALLRDAWRRVRRIAVGDGAGVTPAARVLAALGLAALGTSQLVLSAVALPAKIALFGKIFDDNRRLAREAEIEAPVAARVVILAMDDLLAIDLPAVRAFEQGWTVDQLRALSRRIEDPSAPLPLPLPLPDRIGYGGTKVLSMATTAHRAMRTGTDELELWTPDGTLFDGIWAESIRSPSLALPHGTVVKTHYMTATVRDDRAGRPTRVAFRFDRPLDDPSLLFLIPARGGLRRVVWPPIGTEIAIPRFADQRLRPGSPSTNPPRR